VNSTSSSSNDVALASRCRAKWPWVRDDGVFTSDGRRRPGQCRCTSNTHFFKSNAVVSKGLELQLVENKSCICHEGKLVIPKPLLRRATMWYHHYLQHPWHTRLEETMKAAIYWKGMRTTIWSITKSCKTCQINKKRSLKYGHLPSKIVLSVPWDALCVDLIGPYTLKGKDGSSIDFMALTMIDPASSWLEVVELPTITRVTTKKDNGKERTINRRRNLR
jgi:hypothetical protein